MDLKNLDDGFLCGGTLLPSFQLTATTFLLQLLIFQPVYSKKVRHAAVLRADKLLLEQRNKRDLDFGRRRFYNDRV